MKVNITLDEMDIVKIIAEHFDTDVERVSLSTVEETQGYGLNEGVVTKVIGTVERDIIENGGSIS